MKTANPQPDLTVATITSMDTTTRQPSESERMFLMIERMATDSTVDPAKLREILAVKKDWEADEARKAFASDMAVFQSRCPIINKGEEAYGKKYARIDRIHRETRELRKECGFWFTWSVCEIKGGLAVMEGLLGHRAGHTIPIKQIIPLPDELKGQNQTQRAGSAMTYAKRYGECLALDIVTGDDDDGAGRGKERPVGPSTVAPRDLTVKELATRLWHLLSPVRGAEKNWNAANQWLWKNEILDAGVPETAPDLTAAQFEKAIAGATKILNS